MTPPLDWDMDSLQETAIEEGITFNAIFAELWRQAELHNYSLLPEDLEDETYRLLDDLEIAAWDDLPDDVKAINTPPLALIGRR